MSQKAQANVGWFSIIGFSKDVWGNQKTTKSHHWEAIFKVSLSNKGMQKGPDGRDNFTVGTEILSYSNLDGSGNKAIAAQSDTTVEGPETIYKKANKSIGGALLLNTSFEESDTYCVMCRKVTVKFQQDHLNTFMNGGAGIVNGLLDLLPAGEVLGNFPEYAENILGMIDGYNDYQNTIAKTDRMAIRVVICTDKKTSYTFINVPPVINKSFVSSVGKYHIGQTKRYGVTDNGKTGQFANVKSPTHHVEN